MDSIAEPARPRLSEARAIDHLVSSAREAGLFFDFDGTLAPIEMNPDAVWPTAGVVPALTSLAMQVNRVAIVSARPVSFLRSRLGHIEGLVLFGHYGLQTMSGDGIEMTEPAALPWMPVLRDLAGRAGEQLPPAVHVERKELSVSLHYRAAPHLRPVVEAWAQDQIARTGVAAQLGRMVVEIRPPLERDKGSVITEETSDLATAWYVGDDLSDLRAFEALARREVENRRFVGVRVAVENEETGHSLAGAADFSIAAPAAVPAFLASVSRALADGAAISS